MRKPMCQWLYTFSSVTMFNYRRISSIFASFSSIPMEMNICPTEFLQDWSLSEKTPLSHPIPAKTMWTCATGLSMRVRKRNMDLGWTWHHFAYWTGFPSMRSCPCSCRERRDASTVSQEMASNPEVLGIPIAGDPNLSGIICLIIKYWHSYGAPPVFFLFVWRNQNHHNSQRKKSISTSLTSTGSVSCGDAAICPNSVEKSLAYTGSSRNFLNELTDVDPQFKL